MLTAVGVSFSTGVATLAVHVRLDGAAVSGRHIFDFRSNINDLDAQFVPGDPRGAIEGKFSEIAAIVRSADSYATNGHEHFIRTGLLRLSDLYHAKMFRFFQLNRFHWLLSVGTSCFRVDFRYGPLQPR